MNEEQLFTEIKKHPDKPEAYVKLCLFYMQTRQNDRLKQLFHAVCTQFPFEHVFFKMRAQWAVSLNDKDSAINDFKYCFGLKPDDGDSADSVGVIYQMKKMYDDAAEWHKKALVINPGHQGYMFNCAVALDMAGKKGPAEKKYCEVLEINSNNIKASLNLAVLYKNKGELQKAKALLDAALRNEPDNFSVLMELAGLYKAQGDNSSAVEAYRRASLINPKDETAVFAMKALQGSAPEKPPEKYVESLFNMFSQDFDKKLQEDLEYKVPEIIGRQITEYFTGRTDLRLLDLGAGTGLLAEKIRHVLSYGKAIDISGGMLEKARRKNLYEDIVCADIISETGSMKDVRFDVIAAADVFVYLGNLDKIFENVSHLTEPGGLFVFSVEENDMNKDDYCLKDTARYGHKKEYLSSLAVTYGFKEVFFIPAELRKNKNKPVNGYIAGYTNR